MSPNSIKPIGTSEADPRSPFLWVFASRPQTAVDLPWSPSGHQGRNVTIGELQFLLGPAWDSICAPGNSPKGPHGPYDGPSVLIFNSMFVQLRCRPTNAVQVRPGWTQRRARWTLKDFCFLWFLWILGYDAILSVPSRYSGGSRLWH